MSQAESALVATPPSGFVGAVTRRGYFYGWMVVGACFVAQMVTAVLLQGMSTYLVPLQREFGWSNATIGLGRSFQQVESLLGPINGTLLDRFGPRLMMLMGIGMFTAGLVWLANVDAIWAYYGASTLMGIANSFIGMLVVSVAINNWFRRRRSTALGIAVMGMAFSGMALVPMLAWAQPMFGWRGAALWSAAAVLILGVPIVLLMRDAPEQFGLELDGDALPRLAPGANSARTVDFTYREAITSRTFWFITLASATAMVAQSAAMTYQFGYIELSVSRDAAALVLVVMNLFNMLGRICGGYLGDHFAKRKVLAIDMFGTAAALFVLSTAALEPFLLLFGALFGFAWGVRTPIMGTLHADYFGRSAFGRIMGTAQTAALPLALTGPFLAGVIADKLGGFQPAFMLSSGLACVAGLLYVGARRPMRSTLMQPPGGR